MKTNTISSREREREIIVSFDASINLRVSFSRREGRRIGSTRVSRCTRQLWYTRENRRDERGRGVGVLDISTRLATLVLWGSRREREREARACVRVRETEKREKMGMVEGGTSQTERNRAEGEEGETMPRVFDEAHFASDSSSFRCTRWTTSNAYRI